MSAWGAALVVAGVLFAFAASSRWSARRRSSRRCRRPPRRPSPSIKTDIGVLKERCPPMNSTPPTTNCVEDIQATREQLGATVEELAHRLDVKAQVDEKVAETKEAVHAKVEDAKEKVVETKDTVAAKVGDVTKTVAAKVTDQGDGRRQGRRRQGDRRREGAVGEAGSRSRQPPSRPSRRPASNAAREIPTIAGHAGSSPTSAGAPDGRGDRCREPGRPDRRRRGRARRRARRDPAAEGLTMKLLFKPMTMIFGMVGGSSPRGLQAGLEADRRRGGRRRPRCRRSSAGRRSSLRRRCRARSTGRSRPQSAAAAPRASRR